MVNILKNIIRSHYFSIVISLLFLIVNSIGLFYIKKSFVCECEKCEDLIFPDQNETIIIEDSNEIFIDIKGEVKKPGVYKVPINTRVSEVISLSGGLTKNANTRFINLSKIVKDGEVIVIYSNSEIKNATKTKTITNTVYVDTPCICEEVKNDACLVQNLDIEDPVIENNTTMETNNNETVSSKININTASKEELMTLSGIGEAKAKSIIEYRNNNGLFKGIEDIVNVSGISESIYAKIKENITV